MRKLLGGIFLAEAAENQHTRTFYGCGVHALPTIDHEYYSDRAARKHQNQL